MNILIFDTDILGHHLEYIHHIYEGAIGESEHNYYFAVPKNGFLRVKSKFQWLESNRINWIFLEDQECDKVKIGSKIFQSWHLSCLIRRIAKDINADSVILINLAPTIPILPLLLSRNIRVKGIIYKIYLRNKKSRVSRWVDWIRYTTMAKSEITDKVFILNDSKSSSKLNNIYKTSKFYCLPDPVPEKISIDPQKTRCRLNLSPQDRIFLHFGAMTERKGTLEILRALQKFTHKDYINKCFFFLGKVGKDIKTEFYRIVESLRDRGCNLIIKDEFVSYEELHEMCNIADCILIPYKLSDLSSGVLGYAAVYGVPVIGPSVGLIGEKIGKFNLGERLNEITPEEIASSIKAFQYKRVKSDYALQNSKYNFIKLLID